MAKKFRFDKVFYYRPSAEPRRTDKFDPSSKPQTVTDECAEQATAAGAGEVVEAKKGGKNAGGNA